MDDWLHPNPDRNALSPYSMAECYDSKSSLNGTFLKPSVASLQGWGPGIHASKELPMESSWYSFSSSCSPSGLAQRIAAKAGFDDLTLDTSQMKQMASLPSPLLTIPPGLSPTTLLMDSPVFISNNMAEESSMKSNSPFLECSNPGEFDVGNKINDHLLEDIDLPSFTCKLPQPYLTAADKKPALSMYQQSIAIQGTSNQSHLQPILHHEFSRPPNGKANSADDALLDKKASNNSTGNEFSALLDEPREGELSSASLGSPSEDGYAWRKYGQKHVKGSEFPRSYYKCTHPNCQVKKKVERSHIGHITEIVYKGVHNHLKPPSSSRASFPLCQSANIMQIDGSEQNRTVDLDWKNDGFVANQYASASIEQFDQYSTFQAEGGPQHETPDGIDVSSTLSNDDEDDQVTHASVTLGTEGDEDETEPKRRKLDVCALEMSSGSRGVREPRVVVQTASDVDILDDGYRWRKYGQKVVKGNPNPRSYYKCTNPGCTVRKHIERASHDLKSVITTYEGKHNHEVPAARTSSNQANSSSNSSTITTTTTTAPPSVLPRKAEPARMPDALGRLDVVGPLGCFGFHARGQQLGAAGPSFSFAMAHQGLSQNFAMAGLGQMASLKMPVLPQLPAYMAHHGQGSSIGFMMPKGVTMEAAAAEAGSPISGGSAAYQQLMKMHLGPQM